VTTTLTIPGAIPQGLPGTTGPRPKGAQQRRGKPNKTGQRNPQGGPPGPSGASPSHPLPGGKRARGNRQRRGPKPGGASPGNEAPANVPPTVIDDDIGNR
jgi:hypothetical protein